MKLNITLLLLAGLLSAISQASFAASGDDVDATTTKPTITSGPALPIDTPPVTPSGGNTVNGGATGSSSGRAGGAGGFGSGSGAGGGTGPAGGGTGGAGGGTGSRW